VKLDGRPPRTTSDAPTTPVVGPVVVTLTADDADSGVAATSYALDAGAWTHGTSVPIGGTGAHWLFYYSTDNAGNTEMWHVVMVVLL
jgi:hypothetical protein